MTYELLQAAANELLQAAALIRGRAEAAGKVHPGAWEVAGEGCVVHPITERMSGTVADVFPRGGGDDQAMTAEHVAGMGPAVAVAVAEWLEEAAERAKYFGPAPKALAVARAYLGDS